LALEYLFTALLKRHEMYTEEDAALAEGNNFMKYLHIILITATVLIINYSQLAN